MLNNKHGMERMHCNI